MTIRVFIAILIILLNASCEDDTRMVSTYPSKEGGSTRELIPEPNKVNRLIGQYEELSKTSLHPRLKEPMKIIDLLYFVA